MNILLVILLGGLFFSLYQLYSHRHLYTESPRLRITYLLMVSFWGSLIAYGIFSFGIFAFFAFGFLVAYLVFNRYSTTKTIIELKELSGSLSSRQFIDTSKHVLYNDTALTFACKNGDFRIVKELISSGVNIEETKDGSTPLTHSVAGKHEEIALFLIRHGADVNAMPEGSSSLPLAAAVEDDMLSIARLLLENGADPTLYTDRSDATLVDLAYESGNHKIVELLAEYDQYPFHMLDDYGNKI